MTPVTITAKDSRKLIVVKIPKDVVSYGILIAAMSKGARYLVYNMPGYTWDEEIDLKTNKEVKIIGTSHYKGSTMVFSFDTEPWVDGIIALGTICYLDYNNERVFKNSISSSASFLSLLHSHGIGYAANPLGEKPDKQDPKYDFFDIYTDTVLLDQSLYVRDLEVWQKAESGVLKPDQQYVFIEVKS